MDITIEGIMEIIEAETYTRSGITLGLIGAAKAIMARIETSSAAELAAKDARIAALEAAAWRIVQATSMVEAVNATSDLKKMLMDERTSA